ncbi:MAG: hypothetical protein WAO56_04250 [Miniphocaeibacter sp.]|uniref:hypothetical protein n=1 Tax=Miniphocaeibacter sp. TaxID=3100973 RepID=UPI0017F71846|nr:hypothetical protein [Gallicola sp.]
MDKERIFKKMKTWNMILIIVGIIAILFSVYGLISDLTTDWDEYVVSMKQLYEQAGLSTTSLSVEAFKPSAFKIVQEVISLLIMVYIVLVAVKNNTKINNKESINTLPYILKLILFVFTFVISVIISSGFLDMLPKEASGAMMFIVIFLSILFVIYFIFALLPSIRLLMLSNKLNKLEEEN